MESFATPYPLIFFDGEQEQDKGFVGIHSALTFRRFQSLLSQKTGVPPNQLSTVFVCRKTLKGLEKRQRLPINGNTNFNILLNQHNPNKERDCYFLVSMKKPKKERKGSRKRGAESEVPDELEFNTTNGVEGRDHLSNPSIEETFLQGSASSNYAAEASVSSFMSGSGMSSKHFMDIGVESNRASDNKVGRVILKRGNTSFFQRHGRNYGESQASQQAGGNIVEEYAQLHSPRFAALRPEDQRDLNWKWEESFARAKAREQWDLHTSYALPQTDGDFRPYSPESFNVLYPEDQVGHSTLRRKGRLVDSHNHNFHRNGVPGEPLAHSPLRNREFLHLNYSKPSFLAPRKPPSSALASFRDTDLQRIRDPFFGRQSHLHYLSEGDWQKMPAASGAFVEFQDASSIESGANEESTQSLFCQLCFECKRRNVSPIPFHWCVEDAVTNGFQGPTPAGPIGRRAKAFHVEATA